MSIDESALKIADKALYRDNTTAISEHVDNNCLQVENGNGNSSSLDFWKHRVTTVLWLIE